MNEFDAEIFREYLAEVSESMDGLDEKFVELEKDPAETKIIDSIFRPVHSIKGSSAFFGLLHIQGFAHKLENLLDDLRKGNMAVTPVIIDNLLKGTDYLKLIFKRVGEGDTNYELTAEEKEWIDGLENRISGKEGGKEDEVSIGSIIDSAIEVLEKIQSGGEVETPLLEELSTILNSAKKGSGIDTTVKFGSNSVDRRSVPREDTGPEPPQVGKFGEILLKSGNIDRPTLEKALFEKSEDERVGSFLIGKGLITEEDVNDALKIQDEEKDKESKFRKELSTAKTMRISEDRVDEFMDQVGELVIISEVFNYLEKRLGSIEGAGGVTKEFKNANLNFSELTLRLQHGLSEVRKVAIKSIFQKIPRTVRDLASLTGKDVVVELVGDEIMLDKSLVEKLESPIIHMVRNAVDHGIEKPDVRSAAGKPERGNVVISAEIQGESLQVVLEDDGAGIQRDVIAEKAVSKGLVDRSAVDSLSDKDIFDFIFAPGFSTAVKVTDISGRGVGMDVVKRAIAESKGRIEIESSIGKGSKFTMTVPVSTTLITINGLVTSVGAGKFIFPVEDVKESLRPSGEEVFTIKNDIEMVNIRGDIFPLIRLYNMFNISTEVRDPSDGVCLIIEKDGRSCCVLTDAIVEQQNVVLKDLGKVFRGVKSLMGGAILGDGSIGLVISVDGLLMEQA